MEGGVPCPENAIQRGNRHCRTKRSERLLPAPLKAVVRPLPPRRPRRRPRPSPRPALFRWLRPPRVLRELAVEGRAPIPRRENSPSPPDPYPTLDPAPSGRPRGAGPLAPPPGRRYLWVDAACVDRWADDHPLRWHARFAA